MYTHTNVHKNNNKNIIQIYVATYTVYTKIQKNKKQTNSLSIVPSTYRVRRILRRILLLTSTCHVYEGMHITDKGTFEIGMR